MGIFKRSKRFLLKGFLVTIGLTVFVASIGPIGVSAYGECQYSIIDKNRLASVSSFADSLNGPIVLDPGEGGCTDPGTGTDPGTTDPGTTDPGTTDPGTTDPGTTDPGTVISGTTEIDYQDSIEVITETEEKVVYKTIEDGQEYYYEEYINGDIITTFKYLVDGGNKSLADNFRTTITSNITIYGEVITIVTKDLINNVESSENINLTEMQRESESNYLSMNSQSYEASNEGVYDPNAPGHYKWYKAYGVKMAYYKYSNGGGKARFSTMEKKLYSYDGYYDAFTRRVDALRNLEGGNLKEWLATGLFESTIRYARGGKFTLAGIIKISKKFIKGGGPYFTVAYWLYHYVMEYDKASKYWNRIPKSYYRW